MISKFSARYGDVLQEMLAETAGSIIIKTDAEGFIEDASQGLEKLGMRLSEMLFTPHIADLATGHHAEALRRFHEDTLKGYSSPGALEFPVIQPDTEPAWYSLSLRPAPEPEGGHCGALGLLRSIEGRRSLEQELATAAMTDVATGLANGRAFRAMLGQLLAQGANGSVAIFELDRFASLKLRFGDAAAQEILWAFGRFLGNMLSPDDVLARLEEDRFAILMPHRPGPAGLELAREILSTFIEISKCGARADMHLTASAGVGPIDGSIDTVLIHAERALVVARALGGCRAEMREQMPRWQMRQTGS